MSIENKTLFRGEVIFLRPSYSDSKQAAIITLQVGDMPSDLDIFVGHNNKRYMVALVEIGNDEQPTKTEPYKQHDRLGPLCEWAVMRCKEPKFWEFLSTFDIEPVTTEQEAKDTLVFLCAVDSRKEFDTNPDVAARLKRLILNPYREWLQRDGVTA